MTHEAELPWNNFLRLMRGPAARIFHAIAPLGEAWLVTSHKIRTINAHHTIHDSLPLQQQNRIAKVGGKKLKPVPIASDELDDNNIPF